MKLVYKKYLKTTALVWTGTFVACFLVHMFILSPQKQVRMMVKRELEEKKTLCESAQKATLEKTKIELSKQLEDLRNRLDNFAIDFEEAANLTFDISQISNEQSVGSFSITRNKNNDRQSSSSSGLKYLSEDTIKISFTSGFNQFAVILNSLERNQPVVFIDKFTIVRSDQDASEHRVNMDLKVFVRKRDNS